MGELEPELARYFEAALVAIELAVVDTANPAVGHHFEAVPAGARRGVKLGTVDHDTVLGGLQDGVGFCVDGGDAVVVLHHVAGLVAVRHAAYAAVIAGRQDRAVANDNRPNLLAVTGGAGRCLARNVHEIRMPVDARPAHTLPACGALGH